MISIDKIKYYDIVRYCCCFRDRLSSEGQNIMEKAVTFNQVLSGPFRVTEEDRLDFVGFYREYRVWLLEKYMDPFFSFSSVYLVLSDIRKRYGRDPAAFKSVYGAVSNEELFFAQTFNDFSGSFLEGHSNSHLTAHKMRLGAVKMLLLAGFSNLDWAADQEEEIISKLQGSQS
jgi:hypothetical protein